MCYYLSFNCRMHAGPITCLCLGDDQLIVSGSSLGSISISGLSSDERVAKLRLMDSTGYKHYTVLALFGFFVPIVPWAHLFKKI